MPRARYRLQQELQTAHSGDGNSGDGDMNQQTQKHGWSWWYLLLLVQFVLLLWVPSYNSIEPSFIGMPFFYWYQLAWVIISGILTAIVYFKTEG
jgi:hypothetical protein